MKGIKKGLLAGMVLCCMPVLSACSFKETLGVLWNSEDKSPDGEVQDTQEDISGLKVDENVEKPAIANELGEPVTYGRNGTAEPLTIEASVNDGGTLLTSGIGIMWILTVAELLLKERQRTVTRLLRKRQELPIIM